MFLDAEHSTQILVEWNVNSGLECKQTCSFPTRPLTKVVLPQFLLPSTRQRYTDFCLSCGLNSGGGGGGGGEVEACSTAQSDWLVIM